MSITQLVINKGLAIAPQHTEGPSKQPYILTVPLHVYNTAR